jgi:hypothetical protein
MRAGVALAVVLGAGCLVAPAPRSTAVRSGGHAFRVAVLIGCLCLLGDARRGA